MRKKINVNKEKNSNPCRGRATTLHISLLMEISLSLFLASIFLRKLQLINFKFIFPARFLNTSTDMSADLVKRVNFRWISQIKTVDYITYTWQNSKT